VARRQYALAVDGREYRRIKLLGERTNVGRRIGGTTTGNDEWGLRLCEKCSRCRNEPGIGRRARRQRPGPRPVVHPGGDDVQGNLDVNGTRPRAGEDGKGARQDLRQLLRIEQRVAEGRDTRDQVALRGKLMQPALRHAEMRPGVDTRDHQHGDGIGIGFAHGGRDIGHAGTGDDEAHAGLARGPGIAIGHEAGTLLMARRHMADIRRFEAPIELDRMNARNAENHLDAVGFEKLDQNFTASGHAFSPYSAGAPGVLESAASQSARIARASHPGVRKPKFSSCRGTFRGSLA
jgi:hypothetical protein